MKKNELRNLLFRNFLLEIFIFLLFSFGVNKLYFEYISADVYKYEYAAFLFVISIAIRFLFLRNRLLSDSILGLAIYFALLLEIYGVMIFAQYHFLAAIIICLAIILAYIFLAGIFVKRTKIRKAVSKSEKAQRRCREVFQALGVTIACVVLIIPSIIGTYNELDLQVMSDEAQDMLSESFSETNEQKSESSNLPKEQQKIINNISRWSKLDKKERVTLLYGISLLEKKNLDLDDIEINTSIEKMPSSTLAFYSDENNTLYINVEHICEDSASENITTVCHEIFHAFQYAVINSLDFESDEVKNNYYYKQAREWYQNSKDYKTATVFDYDSYYNQPLEVSAREYALQRGNEYMQMANGLKDIYE